MGKIKKEEESGNMKTKMYGIFDKKGSLMYVRPLKEDAEELVKFGEDGDNISRVTIVWKKKV